MKLIFFLYVDSLILINDIFLCLIRRIVFMLFIYWLKTFLNLDGISCITSRLVESYSAYPDNTRGMVASALQQLTTTFSVRAAPPPALSLSSLIVQSSCTDETLMNFAPLGW